MFKFLNIDYIYSKSAFKSLTILIITTIFLGTTIKNECGYAFIAYIFLAHIILSVDGIEKRVKFNQIINSMPIKRKDIVINKYIRLQFFTILIIIMLFLISNIISSLKPMSIEYSIYLWITITIMYGTYYIFYFISNKKYMDILIITLYASVIGALTPVFYNSSKVIDKLIICKLPYLKNCEWIIYIMVLAIYIISMIISIIGYERLDLE